jgi:DNA invertase Pin-like site-specific DNA recombinase
MSTVPRRAAIYARVSTTGHGQTADNQLLALRSFATARGWTVTEFVDSGQSGKKEKRPQLDAMLAAVKARKVDVVACVKLDRLARSVSHLVGMVRDFDALGVDLVVLDQAIDTTTPSGRLLFHVLASVAEFELDLIRDRIMAGLARARSQGKVLGPPRVQVDVRKAQTLLAQGQSLRGVAKTMGVAVETLRRHVSAATRAIASAPAGRAQQVSV